MPEGPEIRLAADRVERAVRGRPIRAVSFAFETLRPFEQPLSRATVTAVETRGKAMLMRFSCGLSVYSHNQLYGRWYVVRGQRWPSTKRSLRFAVHTAVGRALLYSASSIDVLRDDELGSDPRLARLGPDVLDRSTDAALVETRLRDRRFAGRRLGALLLDQGVVCGLGNYLRSEVLFLAGVRASRRPRDLDDATLRALAHAVVVLPRRSYRTRGVTNDPARERELRARGVPRRERRHFVFGRAGAPCFRCGSSIEKAEAASRRVYYCPGCQPLP